MTDLSLTAKASHEKIGVRRGGNINTLRLTNSQTFEDGGRACGPATFCDVWQEKEQAPCLQQLFCINDRGGHVAVAEAS